MKKILSFIMCVCLLLQCMPAFAKTEAASGAEPALLEKLEVLPKGKKASDNITRLEFAEAAVKLSGMSGIGAEQTYYVDVPYTDERAAAINAAAASGIMSGTGGGRFEPEKNITVTEAVSAVVNLLGYSEYAKTLGTYPTGWQLAASEIGLTKGVSGAADSELSFEIMTALFTNALNAELMLQTSLGEEPEYEVVSGNTLLLKGLKIKTVKGIVQGSYKSALTDYSYAGFGEINIDGREYNIGSYNTDDLIGCYVTAYFTDDDDEELVLIEKNEKKTKELVIGSDDFVSYNGTEIEYSSEDKDKKAKIDKNADVLFEMAPLKAYSEETFKLSDGNIRLIDNDGDGVYNVICLNPVYTIAVKAVNTENKSLTGWFSDNGLDLEDINDEDITVTEADGSAMKFSDIAVGNVVTWSKDASGKYYKLIVNRDAAVEGAVTQISADSVPHVSVNDVEYTVAPSFRDSYRADMKVSDNGILYIDYLGRAVGFRTDKGSTKSWSYGYLLRTYTETDEEEEYYLKTLTESNVVENLKMAKRFSIDFQNVQKSDMENAVAALSEGVIRYKTNSDGEITKLDTVEPDTNPDSLTKKYESDSIGYKGLGVNSFSHMAAMDENTVVFVTPKGGGAVSDYSKRDSSYFSNDSSYDIVAYGKKDAIVSDVIVVRKNNSVDSSSAEYGIVKEISKGLNEDDEGVNILSLSSLSGTYITDEVCYVSNDVDVSGITPGQIVKYTKNVKDEVIALNIMYDYEKNIKSGFSAIGSDIGKSSRLMYGMAARFEGGQLLVTDDDVTDIDSAAVSKEIINFSLYLSQGRVYVYDTEKRKDPLQKGGEGDIYDYASVGSKCSKVVVMTSMVWPRAIIIYK